MELAVEGAGREQSDNGTYLGTLAEADRQTAALTEAPYIGVQENAIIDMF
jgi:hypothetical protein